MRIVYMSDTHFGRYDQQIQDRLEVSQAADQFIDDAMLAERVGFDGVWLAERHARVVLAAEIAARTQRATRGVQPLAGHDLRC